MLGNSLQLGQAGLSLLAAGSDLSPFTVLLMRFESTLLDDENSVWTNTLGTTGSPARSTASPRWGDGCGEIDAAANTQEDFYAQAPTGLYFNDGAGDSGTLDFWFCPVSQGVSGSGAGATLRNCILALSTAYPVVQYPASNLQGWFWWSETSGGTFGFQNGGNVSGIAINTWHHFRACWKADGQCSMWVDGSNRIFNNTLTTQFNTLTVGNQYTAGTALDGAAGDHLTKCKTDSIRYLKGICLSDPSLATITVPTADFL